MDLKEIKKIVTYARKAGVKSISVNGIAVEFKDEILIQRPKGPRLVKPDEDKPVRSPDPLPTLDDINKFIYGTNEEVG